MWHLASYEMISYKNFVIRMLCTSFWLCESLKSPYVMSAFQHTLMPVHHAAARTRTDAHHKLIHSRGRSQLEGFCQSLCGHKLWAMPSLGAHAAASRSWLQLPCSLISICLNMAPDVTALQISRHLHFLWTAVHSKQLVVHLVCEVVSGTCQHGRHVALYCGGKHSKKLSQKTNCELAEAYSLA